MKKRANKHFLFVDDQEVIAQMGKEMLEHLGYEVTACTSSVEALETFRSNPEKFDLMITDQLMPQMTGTQFAAELMRIRPHMGIVLCSGFGEFAAAEDRKKLGIREHIMKPYLAGDLHAAVRRALNQQQEQRL